MTHNALETVLQPSDGSITVENLTVRYRGGEKPAVRAVSLTVAKGERVAIVGESGSGKSSLVSAMLGLLPAGATVETGRVVIGDVDVFSATEAERRELRGKVLGFVPQDPQSNLNPLRKVGSQVSEGAVAHGVVEKSEGSAWAMSLLEQVQIGDAAKRITQYPHQFSGGMRQRVLIASSLSAQPQILLADEPTSALDVTVQKRILDRIDEIIVDRALTFIFITHDLALAAERAEHIIVMYQGEIVERGLAAEILQRPTHEYTKRLVRAALLNTAVSDETDPSGAAIAAEGAQTGGTVGTAESAQPEPLLETKHLRHVYGSGARSHVGLNDVSFTLAAGRTLAVVGESGSGKSTLAQCVLRLLHPSEGLVEFEGANIDSLRGPQLNHFRRSVQPVFQDPSSSLNPSFTVQRAIIEPLVIQGIGDRSSRAKKAAELLELVSLPASYAQRKVTELSGGQKQRVAIARALALDPKVIICDEPVSALDVVVQETILELLTSLQRKLGVAYLFISHDLSVVRRISHEVLVMQQGAIVEQGATSAVFSAPQHPYTRELLAAAPQAHAA